ncbi:hypothetical protein KR50_29420 [Jeotgalibacillus campisalis]|uniref:Uncharacterized protein n=1 Tax=Jeotgalibacillus campisalis TaxID=220754 RepID=A0A0C2VBE7_9BACL|nr:hypothetical protein KR50_29420 [Jeotgalibacillus campisalis]
MVAGNSFVGRETCLIGCLDLHLWGQAFYYEQEFAKMNSEAEGT